MQVAIIGAGFTPSEADRLRRAMATFKSTGGVGEFRDKLIAGMLANGISQEFAERLVKQIEGFGSYGFPESHAASFAKIAYASSWMKCHHPDMFCAALLNAQPMGFYAPAQIVRDAREHGVEVRPVCINDSDWDTRMVPRRQCRPRHAAFCGTDADWAACARSGSACGSCRGLAKADAERDPDARAQIGPFASIEDVWRRSRRASRRRSNGWRAPMRSRRFGLNRRQALWAIKGLGQTPLDLFAAADAREGDRAGERRARRGAGAAHRGARGGRGLSRHPTLAARASGQLPARSADGAAASRAAAISMNMKDGARVEVAGHHPRPPAAGQRQGRGVRHARGRDRHRQCDPVGRPVRGASAHGDVGDDAGDPRQGAARRAS